MYGWKARIGLMIPSANTIIEPEFNAMKPEGISVHATRLMLRVATVEALERMAEDTERAARLLATAGVSIIAYGCTTGSLIRGLGWDQELIRRIESIAGVPATTTATAVLRAFKNLRINTVAIATPYSEELNRCEQTFFEAHGVRVVNMKGLELYGENMRGSSIETTFNLASEVNTPEAEAVFISCTNFKSITVIEELERNLQKPVFSSNTATMWDVLKRLGIREPIKGYGKLLGTI